MTASQMVSEPEARGALLATARVGIVAYGLVYLTVGWIAFQLAFGSGGGEASTSGALRRLGQQPLGTVLLWVVVVGLAAMAVWQLGQAVWGNSWREGRDRGLARAKNVGRAIVYVALSVSAWRIVAGSGGGGSQEESLTARLLSAPAGQLLVAAVGLGVVAVGVYQVRSGITERFTKKLAGADDRVVMLGKIGYVAKGITLVIVGGLFGWAALTADADKAGGMDQALQTLREQPFGPWLLAAMGVGFAAYGLFCFAWARHPRP